MSDNIKIGDLIEQRYELVKFLGEGGFAKVYQAKDISIGRDVAVKFLQVNHMALNDASVAQNIIERFEREARLAANLDHPNVVNIYDIGRINHDVYRPFIVMEMLSGKNLQDLQSDQGPIDPAQLWSWFLPALDALGQAHEMGIIHKDLKPANLFLHAPGQRSESLKIVDFGIAHIRAPVQDEEHGRMTQTGQILGTPQYLPPEYIHSQKVTPAMDVYQMALILIEMLSGEPVVGSTNSLHCLLVHGDGRLEIPEYLLNSQLGPILKKGLALQPRDRFLNADIFADALRSIDPKTIPPSPKKFSPEPLVKRIMTEKNLAPVIAEPSQKKSKTIPIVVALGLLSLVICVGGSFALFYAMSDRHDPRQNDNNKPIAKINPKSIDLPVNVDTPTDKVAPKLTEPDGTKKDPETTKENPDALALKTKQPTPKNKIEPKTTRPKKTKIKKKTTPKKIKKVAAKKPKKVEPKKTLPKVSKPVEIPYAGPLNKDQLNALYKRATLKLKNKDREGAYYDCTRGATLGHQSCYNVIMRASRNFPNNVPDRTLRRGCKTLKKFLTRNPQHKITITVQRNILGCAKHNL